MKCVIMQPTYLPWSGYFNLIAQADVFVFLEDVQYERTSWQNRNRILVAGQPHWITVPAIRETLSQKLNTIQLDDKQPWRKKHTRLLQQTYAKHLYGRELDELVSIINDMTITNLGTLNITLIYKLCEKLNIRTRFVRSSEIDVTGLRSERLLRICQQYGCDEYLSPVSSAAYLTQDKVFDQAPVKLTFHNYVPALYSQKGSRTFVSHLSIVDIVANMGWLDAEHYVRGTYTNPNLKNEVLQNL